MKLIHYNTIIKLLDQGWFFSSQHSGKAYSAYRAASQGDYYLVFLYDNGTETWSKNGYPHREDGAAIIRPNQEPEYWNNGVRLHNLKDKGPQH